MGLERYTRESTGADKEGQTDEERNVVKQC